MAASHRVPAQRCRLQPGTYATWACCLLLVVVTLAVFAPVLKAQFLSFDDDVHIYDNPLLNPPTWAHLGHIWNSPFRHHDVEPDGSVPPYEELYAPLTYSFYALLTQVAPLPQPATTPTGTQSRLNPATFHAANLGVHLLNVLLVFGLAWKLVRRRSAAWAGALLFALHPLQVESVAWVTQLNTLLSTAFTLLCLVFVLNWVGAGEEEEASRLEGVPPSGEAPLRWRWYAAASTMFVLALLAKPTSVLDPGLALVLIAVYHRRQLATAGRWLLPWWVLALGFVWVNARLQPPPDAALWVPWLLRPFQIADAFAWYGFKLVWPWVTMPDYGRTSRWVLSHWWGYATWLLPAACLLLAWRMRRKAPLAGAGLGWFLLTLLPTAGVVAYYWHAYSTVADRYAYLPLVGAALAVAAACARVPQRAQGSNWVAAGLVPVALLLGTVAHLDTAHWHDVGALWTYNRQNNPQSYLSVDSLANYYGRLGQDNPPVMNHAIALYQQAVELNPHPGMTHFNLGLLLGKSGRNSEAVLQLQEAAAALPNNPDILNSLAIYLMRSGFTALALNDWKRAVTLDPPYQDAHINYGTALAMTGNDPAAEAQWQKALALDPNNVDVRYNLGVAYRHQGRLDLARREWQEAVAIDPTAAGPRSALAALARAHPAAARAPRA